jgi:hypothetical protein
MIALIIIHFVVLTITLLVVAYVLDMLNPLNALYIIVGGIIGHRIVYLWMT